MSTNKTNVFTNTYGLARALLAFGTLLTLIFCNQTDIFPVDAFLSAKSTNQDITKFNLFFIFDYENLYIPYLISIIVLILVISGFVPFVTGILHAWISYSFFSASFIIEGGDQITQILTILLIPITLLDKRLNHWGTREILKYERKEWMVYFCKTIFMIVNLQMALLYFFAGSEKLKVVEWQNGSAIYYWFNHNLFGAHGFVESIFSPLINNMYLSPLFNWLVILLELLLAGAIFMNYERRRKLLFFGIGFHLMIFLVHGLPTFFIAMTAGLILYLLPVDTNIKLPQISTGVMRSWFQYFLDRTSFLPSSKSRQET